MTQGSVGPGHPRRARRVGVDRRHLAMLLIRSRMTSRQSRQSFRPPLAVILTCHRPAIHPAHTRSIRNTLAGTQFRHRRRLTFAITLAAGRQSGRTTQKRGNQPRMLGPLVSGGAPRGPTPRPPTSEDRRVTRRAASERKPITMLAIRPPDTSWTVGTRS